MSSFAIFKTAFVHLMVPLPPTLSYGSPRDSAPNGFPVNNADVSETAQRPQPSDAPTDNMHTDCFIAH